MELTYVAFATEDGEFMTGPALVIEGQLWLVPKWREANGEPYWQPAHAIRLPMALVQATPARQDSHWLLSCSIPRCALEGQSGALLGVQFEVLEAPAWLVAMPALQ